ncbi:response regulator transcription factor [Paenarthrobacter sp. AMU7]|uniref:Response regulator transcription factor n=1 Tax=Paenarthrobacter sp. AMU7 TaxID=3162492 RepID=A0AB39YQU4_9MICC
MTSRGICLAIEDDEDISGLLEVILTAAGFDVRAEETGATGLLAADDLDLALITLDLGLPDMDGRDVARKLREVTGAPILMITAHTQPGDELEGMAAGASAYLAKPFRPAQLRALVQELCPQSSHGVRPGTT